LAGAGLVAVLLHPLRSCVSVLCVVAMVTPYVAGTGVARGITRQAETAIAAGAELHVTATRFGRPAPVPLSARSILAAVPGVEAVTPRIVGETTLGRDQIPVVVIGIDPGASSPRLEVVDGDPLSPDGGFEVLLGRQLASRLEMRAGERIPPFYRNPGGEKVARIAGIFHSDVALWNANAMVCSLATAAEIFNQPGHVTGFLVECTTGYREAVKRTLVRMATLDEKSDSSLRPVVQSRDELRALLPQSLGHLHGIFQLHFLLAFAVGIPLLMVTSGVGLSERRREAALLKATGWMTDELMLRGLVESVALTVLGASIASLLAWLWMGPLNAKGVAGIFILGADADPAFRVPFELLPVPVLLSFVVSFLIVATGTLLSIWRAASAAPALVLR